jgi:catechol 2,3-dioxygenase-like lactoylglutathione lyase family enzyme
MGLNKASQCLLVSDVEKSQKYYRDQLGFTIEGQFVEREGVSFLIKKAEKKELTRPNHTVNRYMDTYIWVNDVDLLYEEFKARGAILESEPVNQSYGMREILVYDPDGYRFCIGGPLNHNSASS